MGRADQRTKVKGMFVDPAQWPSCFAGTRRSPRLRLVVGRDGDRDAMTLNVEPAAGAALDAAGDRAAALREATGLGGTVAIVPAGSLPNDGKVIADERDYSTLSQGSVAAARFRLHRKNSGGNMPKSGV